ncbi:MULTISPECIES: phosphate/phosphite/phosphonate ABC transporter substrate-binding protein [Trichocoleus]|uniref:PhnD/SsuA/transferrin family substrate-binding protein n=1 Tax=Trichocoleus desertorum GB2-A4 TaxID=2933944 RepID=A0ABV0JHI3_9CYAN|nr:PhnD/SsuA/transferrin family substrate-binding protein [Trichocoleus sp. FACHB-46]MBD1865102.1 PhnD/SsuA/transferrin family substrate-binding protein [Trichocoleus sp. FACHB-46]
MLPSPLRAVSYLAPNLFWFYQAVIAYLERSLDIEICLVQAEYDPLADPALLQDQLDIAFICGLPFIRHYQVAPAQLQAVVAPVMQAERYQNQPVYFADVIVNAASEVRALEQLAGKTFCYNDLGSNSGYHLLWHRLFQKQYSRAFFSQTATSGSHECSIQWVAKNKVDCAAIDSTVLEQAIRDIPDLSDQLRIIESIGPCPMPPIAVAQRLGKPFLQKLQARLLDPNLDLQLHMHQAGIHRFAVMDSQAYQPIAPSICSFGALRYR